MQRNQTKIFWLLKPFLLKNSVGDLRFGIRVWVLEDENEVLILRLERKSSNTSQFFKVMMINI